MVSYRPSSALSVRNRALEFSYWPAAQNRRLGRHPMLYASDPWTLMHDAAIRNAGQSVVADAQAFLRQAEEFDRAATEARAPEARPLLHYYSFLNVAKAYVLARGSRSVVGKVMHGLEAIPPSSHTIESGYVRTIPSTLQTINAFDEFYSTLRGSRVRNQKIDVNQLMAQSLFGHRLWIQAAPGNDERFIQVEVDLREDRKETRTAWVNLNLPDSSRTGRGLSVERILTEGDLSIRWEAVHGTVDIGGVPTRVFQQKRPIAYGHRPLDVVPDLVKLVKPRLWRSIDTAAPFRRYYLYLSPKDEIRLPQLASIYALMFYLGSVSRYQPSVFLAALAGRYGAFLSEFLASQPKQFLFGMACEFARQEVSSITRL